MPDGLAVWGAVTGSIGTALAVRQEVVSRRRKLSLTHGVNFTMSRPEPGRVLFGWAVLMYWNTGGRPLALEHVGFRYFIEEEGGLCEHRAEVPLGCPPVELAVDGPSYRVYTPLGAVLRAGISPVVPVEAYAMTTGGQEWYGEPSPIIKVPPPDAEPETLIADLETLRTAADEPPWIGGIVSLPREEPHLAEPPPEDTSQAPSE